jgi:hypothetical protein
MAEPSPDFTCALLTATDVATGTLIAGTCNATTYLNLPATPSFDPLTVETLNVTGTEPGPLTLSLREELTGIQYGRIQDRHHWMYRLR